MLVVTKDEPNYFTAQHAALAWAVANQASIAIENARLYEQALNLAALEERQRLARELHDSVSQALFGISLGTNSTRILLERDPSRVSQSLDYIHSLAQAGMAEMRALLFELRPESLELEGLVAALSKQAAAINARYGIKVQTDFSPEPAIPLASKEALYRIGQEAMHNIVKHAQATRIDLRLEASDDRLVLEISDNGVGFDTQASFPGHLGLRSMKERALKLGGNLQLESVPGQGTHIRVQVPVAVPV
jgi:signal transduction histidine kinase